MNILHVYRIVVNTSILKRSSLIFTIVVLILLSTFIVYKFQSTAYIPSDYKVKPRSFNTDGQVVKVILLQNSIITLEVDKREVFLVNYNTNGEKIKQVKIMTLLDFDTANYEISILDANLIQINLIVIPAVSAVNYYTIIVDRNNFQILFNSDFPPPNLLHTDFRAPLVVFDKSNHEVKLIYVGFQGDATPIHQKFYYLWGITINVENKEDVKISGHFESQIIQELSSGGSFVVKTVYYQNEKPVAIFRLSDGPYNFHLHYNGTSISNDTNIIPLKRENIDDNFSLVQYYNNERYLMEFDRTLFKMYFGGIQATQNTNVKEHNNILAVDQNKVAVALQNPNNYNFELYLVSKMFNSILSTQLVLENYDLHIIRKIAIQGNTFLILTKNSNTIVIFEIPRSAVFVLFAIPIPQIAILALIPTSIFYWKYTRKSSRSYSSNLFPEHKDST